MKNIKSLIQFAVLLCVGLGLIWFSVRKITPAEKAEIITAFETADYFWVFIGMLISLLSHFLRAYRWNDLLKPVGQRVDVLNATCHVLIGYLANYGIPRMGEISRCSLATRYDKVPFEIGFGTVITERIVDFLLFLIIFFITLAVQFSSLIGLANQLIFDPLKLRLGLITQNPAQLVLLIVAVVLVIAAIVYFRKKFSNLFRGKFGGILKGLAEGIGSVRKMQRPFRFIFLSVAIWLCYFYSLYVCFFALKGTSHLGQGECLVLLLFGTFGVIFSPGGLGAYPAIVGGILLYTYNVDKVSAFAFPWLAWTSQFVLIVVLGVLSLIILPIYNRNKNVVSPTAQP